jgi:hypothetical protein
VPTNVATGEITPANALHPVQAAPPVAGITPVAAWPSPAEAQGGVADTAGQQQDRLSGYGGDCATAIHAGMTAEDGRRQHYEAQQMPVGGHLGDVLTLPAVPTNAVPPSQSDDYPYSGMEPTPTGAGMADTTGNLPGP